MPGDKTNHPVRPEIIRKQLGQLGHDLPWLAERLSLKVVEGWFAGQLPDDGLTIVMKLKSEEASYPVHYSLEEYLEFEIQAAELGVTVPELIAQAIRRYSEDSRPRSIPKYRKEGNIIMVDFARGS